MKARLHLGTRPILSLDVHFLKDKLSGELLRVVACNINDQMYSVAWAYVEG